MTDQDTTSCIFCKPAPDAVLFKDSDGIVLLDDPIRVGHVLVGTITHRTSLHDVAPDDAARMMRLAGRVSKRVVELTGAEKTYVVAIGDKDKHFHVHLIPKLLQDPPMGPHIFSGKGWASFLPTTVDPEDVHRFNQSLVSGL